MLFSLVINEVMYNPKGAESGTDSPGDRNEYVELYNETDDTVCIDGYFIKDNMEKDSIVSFPDTLIYDFCDSCTISNLIPPHAYAVILDRDYLHQGEYHAPYRFGKNTVLLSTYDTDIGNGLSENDNLFLIKGNDTIDTYGTPDEQDALPLSSKDGISIERLNPYYKDDVKNWALSDSCTPGYKNSVSFEKDLSIDSVFVSSFMPPLLDTVKYTVFLTNKGWEDIGDFYITVKTETETERYLINGPLGFLQTRTITGYIVPLKKGLFTLTFYHNVLDERPENDTTYMYLTIQIPQIVINEIMYDDTVEWIEIYNASNETLNTGFVVKDRSNATSLPTNRVEFNPGDYLVITGDSSFSNRFPDVPFAWVEGFPTLNNSYETIYLLTQNGALLDSVYYTSSYGGSFGKSIEKINPYLPSSEKSSWKTCTDPKGGTPGRENSVYAAFSGEKNKVSLSRHTIRYSLHEKIVFTFMQDEGPVRFYLFSLDGKPYGMIHYESAPLGEWTWDGYVKSNKLPEGPYIVYIECKHFRQKEIIVIEK